MSGQSQSATPRVRSRLSVVGVLAVVLFGTPLATAQEPEDSAEARMEKIAATYRLTEPVLKKYAAAMRELREIARKDPSVLETRDISERAHPTVRAAFTRAGLTEDEAQKFVIALAYAQMSTLGASMSDEGARELATAPPVLRANVAFAKAHEAELKALGADMNAMKSGGAGEVERRRELKVTGSMRAGMNSEIEVEVTGGPNAGRYTAKVSEGGCSYGLAKPGAWGNQYSITTEDRRKFSSLQLIVPDTESAASGAESFLLMVGFGPLFSLSGPAGAQYKVETSDDRRSEGRGTVRVQDSGAGATVTFDATTKDGVRLKGTIKCHTVMRMG